MSALIIVSRAGHYVALMSLVGSFSFLLLIATPAFRKASVRELGAGNRLDHFIRRLIWWSLALALVTGALWLAAQSASMSGLPLIRALTPPILGTVLFKTEFGHVWLARAALIVVLGLHLALDRGPRGARGWPRFAIVGGSLSALLLVALSFVGHANAETGTDHYIHLAADMVHLLASAAWLGALIPLAYVLTPHARSVTGAWLTVACEATRHFSTIGMISVTGLVATGLVNGWYLVGNVAGLVGTSYGHLLLVKLAIFSLMICLAAINRRRLTPQLMALPRIRTFEAIPGCLRWLRRNAIMETALGIALLTVLAALGTSVPALHTEAVWPFPFDLSWSQAVMLDPGIKGPVAIAASASVLGACVIVYGLWRNRRWVATGGVICLAVALVISMSLLAVPAYPTSYFHSPIRYGAASIARGEPIYNDNCAACHGTDGYGDGPLAASLSERPPDLTGQHLFHHGEGTLFWWISNGIEGTPMPGFGQILSDNEEWDLLNYLHAQADAEQASAMEVDTEPMRPIVAPDFTFQFDDKAQETLTQRRGHSIVLLVLFSTPASLDRLRQLDAAEKQLEDAGVQIVAIPMTQAEGLIAAEKGLGLHRLKIAETGPETAQTYRLFRRTVIEGVPPVPPHLEFLIDLSGYLRFRWKLGDEPGWGDLATLFKRIDTLNHEPAHPIAPAAHMH